MLFAASHTGLPARTFLHAVSSVAVHSTHVPGPPLGKQAGRCNVGHRLGVPGGELLFPLHGTQALFVHTGSFTPPMPAGVPGVPGVPACVHVIAGPPDLVPPAHSTQAPLSRHAGRSLGHWNDPTPD